MRDKKHIPLFRSPEGIEDIMNNIRFFSSDSDITISLKKLNYYMLIAAFLISAILFFAMHQTKTMYDEVYAVTSQLRESEETSYDLQAASDYLTEEIRLFAITGDKKHLDNYFEEANVTKRRDKALELLKAKHKDSSAYLELQTAMNVSQFLMIAEYHAARLTVDAYGYNIKDFPKEIQSVQLPKNEASLPPQQKGEAAKQLLFNEDYRKQKDVISDHMMNCVMDLEKAIWEKQMFVSNRLKDTMFLEHALTVLLIVVLLSIVYLTSRLVIFPLQDCVSLIRKDKEIPEKGAAEIRFLARTYNKMRESNLRHREQLSYEASHDKLTTLYNRRGFSALLEDLDLSNAAVLMVDLDKFKSVNDIYGHDIGDKVLIKVSETLLEHFGEDGHVCRLGGDEFVVVLENATPAVQDQLKKQIQVINQTLRAAKDGIPPVSVSVGVSFCNGDNDVKSILKLADAALYEAKEGGRSDVRFNTEK